MAKLRVRSVYKPRLKGGQAEAEIAGIWTELLFGGTSYSWSGGDKTSTDTDFIDLDTDSAQTPAGTKNLSLTCQPNILDPVYRAIRDDGFYDDQTFNVRFRKLAAKNVLFAGVAQNTVVVTTAGLVTFAGNGAARSAWQACQGTLKYGLLASPGDDAAEITQLNEDNLDNLLIINEVDDMAQTAVATKWDGSAPVAVSATTHWKLIQYGAHIEMGLCSVLSAGNMDVDTTGVATETISFQQTAARKLIITPVLQTLP